MAGYLRSDKGEEMRSQRGRVGNGVEEGRGTCSRNFFSASSVSGKAVLVT